MLLRYVKVGLVTVLALILWTAAAAYLGLYGAWMRSVAAPGDLAGFNAWAVDAAEQNPGATALVLIKDGAVAYRHLAGGVDAHTLFPTASFSKWITALAVLHLVEEGHVDLDNPVEAYITRWQLPETGFDNQSVTVRRLLSHTAGLTDGLGFGDYTAQETVPDLEASLAAPRASGSRQVQIAVWEEPGSGFRYSGGGFLVLELLVEEVSGRRFADYVREAVLTPAGMARSTHAYLGDADNASPSFHPDGTPAPVYRYASAAATGFASSAEDLTRLVRTVMAGDVLAPATLARMRQGEASTLGADIWGLGTMLYAPTPGGDHVYGHDGANEPAINATVRINPETGDAIIVLVNGHPSLATRIGGEWVLWQTGVPDFLNFDRALQSALWPVLIGSLVILVLAAVSVRRVRFRFPRTSN